MLIWAVKNRICKGDALCQRRSYCGIKRRRLGIIHHYEEVTKNKAKTARYFGISRAIFYRWYDRYQKYGAEGLRDQSRRPLNSHRATKAEIIGKIVYLREHYQLGPWKIQMYLKRYHDIRFPSLYFLNALHQSRDYAGNTFWPQLDIYLPHILHYAAFAHNEGG